MLVPRDIQGKAENRNVFVRSAFSVLSFMLTPQELIAIAEKIEERVNQADDASDAYALRDPAAKLRRLARRLKRRERRNRLLQAFQVLSLRGRGRDEYEKDRVRLLFRQAVEHGMARAVDRSSHDPFSADDCHHLGALRLQVRRIWDCSNELTIEQKFSLAELLRDLADQIECRPD